jgi:ankyrin repeat protein
MSLFHTDKGFLAAAAAGDIALLREYLDDKSGRKHMGAVERKTGETALHKAVAAGHEDAVRLLVSRAVNSFWVHQNDSGGRSAFAVAVSAGQEGIFKFLLTQEAVLGSLQDCGAGSALRVALDCNRMEMFRAILATGRADLATGKPPLLYHAVASGKPEYLAVLLERGANPNVPYVAAGYELAREGYTTSARSSWSDQPETPLFRAVMKKDLSLVQQLLRAGAKAGSEELPLLPAAAEGAADLVGALLAAKAADVNAANEKGRTALHFAVEKDMPAMLKLLLEQGADPRAADKEGRTPLHIAVEKNFPGMAELLLAQGADPVAVDKAGKTPLTLAQQFCRTDLIGVLRAAAEARGAATEAPEVLAKEHPLAAPEIRLPAQKVTPAAEIKSAATPPTEEWKLAGNIVLGHRLDLSELGRSLTELFNFESRERIVITENLAFKTETMGPPESFDVISKDSLTKAFAEYRRLGGTRDEDFVFGSHRVKIAVKPA